MKLSLVCLLLLCISPVLLFPTADEGESDASVADVAILLEQSTETNIETSENKEELVKPTNESSPTSNGEADDDDDDEESSEVTTPKSARNKHKHNKRPNKRTRNRNNQVKHDNKRTQGFRRRPANGKKGERKSVKSQIEYEPRSVQTDKLNEAVDDMLLLFSQSLKKDNSTYNWRLGRIPSKFRVQPWGYVLTVEKKTESEIDTKLRFERATREEAVDDAEEEDDDETTTSNDEMTTESTSTAETNDTDDDFEDDDDEAKSVNATEARSDSKESRFQLSEKPWPVSLPDGTVEYNLQLLSEDDLEDKNSSELDDTRMPRKSKNKKENRNRGYSSRRYPRRIYAQIEGIENIERAEDVLIGNRGNLSTTRYIDTKVKIGPIKFILSDSAYPLNNTRVTSPLLTARLRLMEKDGKLVTAKLKREKIRPNDVIVTLQAENAEEKNLPADADRMVNYFSYEMSKMWNSGHILNRVKRQFKQLYVKTNEKYYNEEARKLTQKMLSLSHVPSELNGPSTSTPLVLE